MYSLVFQRFNFPWIKRTAAHGVVVWKERHAAGISSPCIAGVGAVRRFSQATGGYFRKKTPGNRSSAARYACRIKKNYTFFILTKEINRLGRLVVFSVESGNVFAFATPWLSSTGCPALGGEDDRRQNINPLDKVACERIERIPAAANGFRTFIFPRGARNAIAHFLASWGEPTHPQTLPPSPPRIPGARRLLSAPS